MYHMRIKVQLQLIAILLFAFPIVSVAQSVSITTNSSAELTVCENSKSFTISITNDSSTTLTEIALNIAFPQGITYEAGSLTETSGYTNYGVTEDNISNLSSINLNIGNLPKDSTISMVFNARAGFGAIAHQSAGNIFRNNMTVAYNGGTFTGQSNAYNVLFGALSITQVTPLSQSVYVGGTYTRQVKVVNGGFGRIGAFDLHDVYDSTKVKTIATNKGTLNADGSKISLTAADFASIGNGDGWFDLNESITITETVKAIGCVDATSQVFGRRGCDGQFTTSNSKYPFTDITLYSPNILVSAVQSTGLTLTCNNVPFTSTVVNGKREVKIDYSPASLNIAGCNSFNGFVFENGDQVTVVATYNVTGNIGRNTKGVLITVRIMNFT